MPRDHSSEITTRIREDLRFTSNSYDLVIEGESYRKRQKPGTKSGKTSRRGDQ
jgi:hypothetical protein